MAKQAHDLKPGMVFISDKIQITVIEIKDGSVEVLVIKPGNAGVVKEWDNEKFLKKTKKLVIAPLNPARGLDQKGFVGKKPNSQDVQIKGAIIRAEDVLLKMHPVKPNNHGVEDFFVFAINAQEQKMLIGNSPKDSSPMWVDAQTILAQISEEHILKIATAEFDADSFEELREKATNIFKKLEGKD